jgi:protein TonB
MDGDYGNFIVDDFNMDGKEDFAIKKDCGQGLAGCHYIFYTLRNDGSFREDTFLTNEISNPPSIDTKSKTISTWHVDWDLPSTTEADPQGFIRKFYSYDPSTETWTNIKTVHENRSSESSLNNNSTGEIISNPINEKESELLVINKRLSKKTTTNELISQQPEKDVDDREKSKEVANADVDKIYSRVNIEASFPGGPGKWAQFIQRAIFSKTDEFSKSDYGTCVVMFIVDKSGKVSNVNATTMKGTKLAEIAIDAIKKGPNWIPAQINGRMVNAYRLQPVSLTDPNR